MTYEQGSIVILALGMVIGLLFVISHKLNK